MRNAVEEQRHRPHTEYTLEEIKPIWSLFFGVFLGGFVSDSQEENAPAVTKVLK